MIIYFTLYAILAVTSSILNPVRDDKKVARIICIVGFVSISLMLALRHPSMGHDLRYLESTGYLASFDRISTISWKNIWSYTIQNYEKGYIVLNRLISEIKNDRQFFLAVCAVLSTLPVAVCIYKKSVEPLQAFIIYLGLPAFLMSYSGLRQAIAIGLCFYAICFIQDKKLIKFVVLVLLAGTMHSSAFIFLFAYPTYYIRMSKNARIVSVFSIPLVYILRYPLFNVLSKLFKDDVAIVETNSLTLFLVFSLVYIFCIMYTDYSKEQNGLMNIFLLACLCQAFGGLHNLAMRVGYYFMMALVLLLPSVIKNMNIKLDKEIFAKIVFICFAAFGLYSIYKSTWACAYPYYFYWQSLY